MLTPTGLREENSERTNGLSREILTWDRFVRLVSLWEVLKTYAYDFVEINRILRSVESLLIYRLRPPGNIGGTGSRALRPGLREKCVGDWPLKRCGFRDV